MFKLMGCLSCGPRKQVPEWKLNGTAKPEVALDTLSLETLREICRDLEMDYPADKAAAVAAISQSSGCTQVRIPGTPTQSHTGCMPGACVLHDFSPVFSCHHVTKHWSSPLHRSSPPSHFRILKYTR